MGDYCAAVIRWDARKEDRATQVKEFLDENAHNAQFQIYEAHGLATGFFKGSWPGFFTTQVAPLMPPWMQAIEVMPAEGVDEDGAFTPDPYCHNGLPGA